MIISLWRHGGHAGLNAVFITTTVNINSLADVGNNFHQNEARLRLARDIQLGHLTRWAFPSMR